MVSPIILNNLNSGITTVQVNQLLKLNNESINYGLTLSTENIEEIINTRNNILKNYGRLELEISVTKQIIENLYASQYTDKDDYVELINDLQEIFYYLKNETLDEISDIEIIEKINEFYNISCGEIENIQNLAEKFAHEYRWGE